MTSYKDEKLRDIVKDIAKQIIYWTLRFYKTILWDYLVVANYQTSRHPRKNWTVLVGCGAWLALALILFHFAGFF